VEVAVSIAAQTDANEAAILQDLLRKLGQDDEHERWLAAATLVELGPAGLDAVLADIIVRPIGERLRRSYVYILERQSDPWAIIRVRRLLAALRGPVYRVSAPLLAFGCLHPKETIVHSAWVTS
jgi:hypothetical protein